MSKGLLRIDRQKFTGVVSILVFLASGILDVKEEEVKAAIASNPALEICETAHQGEWVGIVARKVSE